MLVDFSVMCLGSSLNSRLLKLVENRLRLRLYSRY